MQILKNNNNKIYFTRSIKNSETSQKIIARSYMEKLEANSGDQTVRLCELDTEQPIYLAEPSKKQNSLKSDSFLNNNNTTRNDSNSLTQNNSGLNPNSNDEIQDQILSDNQIIKNIDDQNDDILDQIIPPKEEILVNQKYIQRIEQMRPQFRAQISLEPHPLKKFDWNLKEDKKGWKFYVFINDQTEEICTRVQTKFTLPKGPEQLINIIKDLSLKPKIDPMFEQGHEFDDKIKENITIQHWLLKGQAIVAQRHFTVLSQLVESENCVEIIAQGMDDYEKEQEIPYNINSAVRVKLSLGGWKIEKENNNNNEYNITYMQCSNPNGKLPFFIKKQTPKFALEMVKNIKKLVDKQNKNN